MMSYNSARVELKLKLPVSVMRPVYKQEATASVRPVPMARLSCGSAAFIRSSLKSSL